MPDATAYGPTRRLATYGTLAPRRSNHHQLADLPGRWLTGYVRGSLTHAGWGADLGYPGLILHDDGDRIEVFIFESAALPEHWERLDAFEGSGYRRVITTAHTAEGTLQTSIYEVTSTSDDDEPVEP